MATIFQVLSHLHFKNNKSDVTLSIDKFLSKELKLILALRRTFVAIEMKSTKIVVVVVVAPPSSWSKDDPQLSKIKLTYQVPLLDYLFSQTGSVVLSWYFVTVKKLLVPNLYLCVKHSRHCSPQMSGLIQFCKSVDLSVLNCAIFIAFDVIMYVMRHGVGAFVILSGTEVLQDGGSVNMFKVLIYVPHY